MALGKVATEPATADVLHLAPGYYAETEDSVRWLVEVAPSERAFLEAFFLTIYTRAHADGTVDQVIDEVLDFPHKLA